MSSLLPRLRRATIDFVEYGSEGATPERALMMRRARGFGLVAFVLMATILASTLLGGRETTAYIAIGGMVVYGISMFVTSLERGRYAHLSANASITFLLAMITWGSMLVGGAPSSSVVYPSVLILGTMYVLGIRTAAFWTAASIACLALVTFTAVLPPPAPGGLETSAAIVFSSRAVSILAVFSIAGLGRRFEDKQTEQLQFMARHDPLTGLCNRREFEERVHEALARARRYDRSPGLLFIDLDRFKQINDEYGHGVGDDVLRGIATVLQAHTRQTDAAGRVGGDEFVVLLEDASDEKSAERYAERLLAEIAATEGEHIAPIQVRASIGAALFPADGTDIESLTRSADSAMYRAKQAGGNRVALARPEPLDES